MTDNSETIRDAERFRFLVRSKASINYIDIPYEGFSRCEVNGHSKVARKSLGDAIDISIKNEQTIAEP